MKEIPGEIIKAADEIRQNRYPQARVVFLAGSLVRGDGTSASDLDLVVILDRMPSAYRESFVFDGWPVDAFIHDPQTLEYFFREVDRPSGVPSLPAMVAEGIEIPCACEFSGSLKRMASAVLDEGPPKWSEEDLSNSRYEITDLVDDIRDPRSPQELHATGTVLYSTLANHYFRSRGVWSAMGKAIPKKLNELDENFAGRFINGFERLFSDNNAAPVIELAAEILEPDGGFFFEGYRRKAPESWRIG